MCNFDNSAFEPPSVDPFPSTSTHEPGGCGGGATSRGGIEVVGMCDNACALFAADLWLYSFEIRSALPVQQATH